MALHSEEPDDARVTSGSVGSVAREGGSNPEYYGLFAEPMSLSLTSGGGDYWKKVLSSTFFEIDVGLRRYDNKATLA